VLPSRYPDHEGAAVKRAIVVGTGAGGAVVARALAGAMDVTVLEAGPEFRRFDGDLGRLDRLRSSRLLRDPRMIRLLFPEMRVTMASDGMALVYGMATGGTTTLATGNALRCDQDLLRRGVDLGQEFRSLEAELPLSTGHRARWRPVTKGLFASCERLGLRPVVTPKLVDYARCTRCGRCVLGCPTGAKWDSRQFLEQAVEQGVRLVTHTTVERVVTEGGDQTRGEAGGKTTGVIVRSGARRRFLAADLVVLAAGGFGTGAILARSGMRTENRLFVDPVLCVAARADASFADEEVQMPFYVEGDGYMISPYFDYLSFFFNPAWRQRRHDIVSLMIKLADSESGTVGRRAVSKGLSAVDKERLNAATERCVDVLGGLGIERDRVFLGTLNAGHPGGTLPLTGRERKPLHPDHLPGNLYVADASLLPQSLGKPPILTIMALAHRVGTICADQFA
jgi:choline dehydrogenase-like flavoprotein